ncbi:MAG: DUF4349 domain-containing protein [Phycisphaerales bacterium]|nr:DUF4349 domain-containing protein [Phycisphaerales bacterium]
MTPAPHDKLETQLARLTTWDEEAPNLWRDALKSAPDRRAHRLLNWPVPRWVLGTTCTAAAVLLLIAFMQPALSSARVTAKKSPVASSLQGIGQPMSLYNAEDSAGAEYAPRLVTGGFAAASPRADIADPSLAVLGDRGGEGRYRAGDEEASRSQSADGEASVASRPGAERQIVRKATIELETKDVRAAYLKAQQIINEAAGEYVQDSALTDTGAAQLQGNLTLRVAAPRLSEVLNELRGLGKVRGERNDGTDVTSQAVDLEARIRNEQRVEKELLELLESRKDAALKDILDLRANLASVRNVIEQLTAQRQNLARLVSLATVLVIIRTDDAPAPEPPAPGIAAYFADAFSTMWLKGLRVLADTLATLLGTLIGGLPWWILLVVTVVVVRSVVRRRAV